jgi:hypothetical protein
MLLIEAQSDFAQRARSVASRGIEADHLPLQEFHDTERWVQLSVGAALVQAAEEGLEKFTWVTPRNRVQRASLAPEAAQITYGHAVPTAVKRILRWLGVDPESVLEDVPGNPRDANRVSPTLRLTPELRKLIKDAGVPALGIAGIALAGQAKVKEFSSETRKAPGS